MIQERIWFLVSLQVSGEASPSELKELRELLQQHPEEGMKVEIYRNIWLHNTETNADDNITLSFDKHLQRLSNFSSEPVLKFETTGSDALENEEDNSFRAGNKFKWFWIISALAACLLIFFLPFWESPNKEINKQKIAGNTISTRAGSKSKVQLPDGTQVWLNGDSKISYRENFLGSTREVQLVGEAYFDVVKDKARPFIIHANTIDVKVLGTAFNIRAYANESTTETALINGSLEVMIHDGLDKKIVLKPNEKLVINNSRVPVQDSVNMEAKTEKEDAPLLTLGKVHIDKKENAIAETMWVKNKLAFEGESLERIISSLEHWYNIEFIVKNEELKAVHFTGVFDNKSLQEVMDALRFSGHFHYEISNGKVVIW